MDEVPDETESTSDPEELSNSLENMRGEEAILVEDGGRDPSWGKDKSEKGVSGPREICGPIEVI